MRIQRLLLAALLTQAAACAKNLCDERDALTGEPAIQVIGDSVFAWNEEICQSVGAHLALALDEPVANLAVNSAQITGGIPGQYKSGAWDVVVIDGGGNDVNSRCDCGDCDAVIERVDTALRETAERALQDGARVVLVGYHGVHPSAWYGFERCGEAIPAVDDNTRAFAASDPRIEFVDLEDVMSFERSPGLYDFDSVHPNPNGAAALAEAIADGVRRARSAGDVSTTPAP